MTVLLGAARAIRRSCDHAGHRSSPAPDRHRTLQAMVPAHAAELAELRTARQHQDVALAAARAGIIEQRFKSETLKARLAKLLGAAFGRSSEKLRDQVEQLELSLADIEEMLAETVPPGEPADEATTIPVPKRRRPLPEALPRYIVTHAAPCSCPACGDVLRPLGDDVTEILECVPGSFRVVQHVCPKLSRRACQTIAQASAPTLPIRRGGSVGNSVYGPGSVIRLGPWQIARRRGWRIGLWP